MNTVESLIQLEGSVVNGRFRLLRCLGGARTTAVYLTAYEDNPPRMAALKLTAASAPDAEVRLAGWSAAARLSHPNLIGVIDCGRSQIDGWGFVYEVMEYADEVLSEILPARPLTDDEAREMLGPVLNALEYLHAQGYVHGRIKPSNVLVVSDRLKLSADCIALAAGSQANRTEASVYDAPELVHGAITPAVDVWALGMTLVAALTQRPAQWERAYQDQPVISAEIVEPFQQIVHACLQVNPADRCTLDEVKAALEPGSPPLFVARRPELANPLEPTRFAGSWKAALIALAAVVVVAGAALMVRKSEFPANETKGGEQQTSAGNEQQTPSSASVAPRAPKTATGKPSPSGRSRQPAPETNAGAGPATVSPVTESSGVLLRVNPEVLPAAQQSIRGEVNVAVRVTVDAAGNVTDAELQAPSGSRYFNRIAVEAARQWKFAAGVGGAWRVQFQFRHDGTDLAATRE
jgi:TonB family protein